MKLKNKITFLAFHAFPLFLALDGGQQAALSD
jgi:hypothetical protein